MFLAFRGMRNHSHGLVVSANFALAALALAALAACGGTGSPSSEPAERPARDVQPAEPASPSATPTPAAAGTGVYVAVGASETAGVGAGDPQREAWPRVLHNKALGASAYLNLGVSGSTVAEALAAQLPQALAAEPEVATVWLAVNDITHLVPVQAYEQQLGTLVHALRRDGRTQVLVGNVPAVQDLPAYRACLPGAAASAVECTLPVVPPLAQVEATVAAFNAAIDRVVAAEGAQLVDLSARRDLTRLTSDDGFHPSTRGHRLIASTFAQELEL